jgi:hypothetical protein
MAERKVDSFHVSLPYGAKEELIELARRNYTSPTTTARQIIMRELEKAREGSKGKAA